MGQSMIFFFAGIIIFGALLFFLICKSKKGFKHLDVEHYRSKCLEIEHQLKQDDPLSYHMAVLNADKLVDQALRERDIKGQNMGERMKNSNSIFTDKNGVWTAHKLRNKIAHESDAQISYNEAKKALINFRRALKDLGAI